MVEIRYDEREVVKNYRVYWPVLESRGAATTKADEFRRAGVRDGGVIGKGPLTNAVSFGVFRSESNMRRRVAELEKLCYAASTVANMKTVSEYSIEAAVGDDRSIYDDAWAARFPEHPVRYGACTASPG